MLPDLKSWGFAGACGHSRHCKTLVVVFPLHKRPRKMLVAMQMVKKKIQREQDKMIAIGEPF